MIKQGILLINLGTPDAPTPKAVRKYLQEFLSDPLVTKIPRIILKIILFIRGKKSAKLYQKIWLPQGSPLRVYSEELANKLQNYLGENYKIILAMRYGKPDIETGLEIFEKLNIKNIIILTLYQQYSNSTTGSIISIIDKINKLNKYNKINLKIINNYYNNNYYTQIIGESLRNINTNIKTNKILFSFHGLPQKFIEQGDVYLEHCKKTVKNIADYLKLDQNNYKMAFQSRVGYAQWLGPYTEEVLKQWAESGVKSVAVICPGFAVDCLETLEEINMRAREVFLKEGGENFYYIPALNSSEAHIKLLTDILLNDRSASN